MNQWNQHRYEIKLPTGCTHDARKNHYGETFILRDIRYSIRMSSRKRKMNYRKQILNSLLKPLDYELGQTGREN